MFPVGDWQFWVATLVVAGVVGLGVRRLLRRRARRHKKPVALTIERRRSG